MQEVDTLLPGLVDLHKAKAGDWVVIIEDVNALAAKLVVLKQTFPDTNVLRVRCPQRRSWRGQRAASWAGAVLGCTVGGGVRPGSAKLTLRVH